MESLVLIEKEDIWMERTLTIGIDSFRGTRSRYVCGAFSSRDRDLKAASLCGGGLLCGCDDR
jgi:hypothetical protein